MLLSHCLLYICTSKICSGFSAGGNLWKLQASMFRGYLLVFRRVSVQELKYFGHVKFENPSFLPRNCWDLKKNMMISFLSWRFLFGICSECLALETRSKGGRTHSVLV